MQTIYIIAAIIALFLIMLLMFIKKKQKPETKLSVLAGISLAFIVAGIVFGDNRIIGYSLMGIGVIVAVIDTFLKQKNK